MFEKVLILERCDFDLKDLSHSILSYFRHVQNYIISKETWKIFNNAIELQVVQFVLKSYTWSQNRKSAQREIDLKSQVWFQTKIARPEVQLPLYYIHFEIAQFNSLNTRTARFFLLTEKECDLDLFVNKSYRWELNRSQG